MKNKIQNTLTSSLESLRSRFAGQKIIEFSALTAGLRTSSPIDQFQIMEGMSSFVQQFPKLTKKKVGDVGSFTMLSEEDDSKDQILVKIDDAQNLLFAWGSKVAIDLDKELRAVFELFQEKFRISSLNADFVDMQALATAKVIGPVPQAFLRAFYRESPLSKVCPEDQLLQNDIRVRYCPRDGIRCVLSCTGDIDEEGLLRGKYSECLVKISMGVGLVAVPPAQPLSLTIAEHSAFAMQLFLDSFIPYIIEPLDTELNSIHKVGE